VAGPQPIHTDRARAESFGAIAAAYDRYRPGYPAALIDDLVALKPRTVLDVGCGTGKAARQLIARGMTVLGVEIDPQMAAVAQDHGVPTEVAGFEQWDDAGRRFDLIVSGQAWHWIDPATGPHKAARVLGSGGAAVFFWNHDGDLPADVQDELDAVYRRHAPALLEIAKQDRTRKEGRPYFDGVRGSGAFASVETRDYAFERRYPADEWVGAVQTHSDHLQLEPALRARLGDALRDVIVHRLGGAITTSGGTYSIWARP
jgi:SAM-dependent methyltransferase